jgi:hypothetical protein
MKSPRRRKPSRKANVSEAELEATLAARAAWLKLMGAADADAVATAVREIRAELSQGMKPRFPSGKITAYAHPIRAVKHKRGVRPTQARPGHTQARREFAQAEIINRFPRGLPEKRPRDLVRNVRAALARNPKWQALGYEEMSRRTIMRAWEELQKP